MGAGSSVPTPDKLRRIVYLRLYNAARREQLSIRALCAKRVQATGGLDAGGFMSAAAFKEVAEISGFALSNNKAEGMCALFGDGERVQFSRFEDFIISRVRSAQTVYAWPLWLIYVPTRRSPLNEEWKGSLSR